jgi:hypothetical protein
MVGALVSSFDNECHTEQQLYTDICIFVSIFVHICIHSFRRCSKSYIDNSGCLSSFLISHGTFSVNGYCPPLCSAAYIHKPELFCFNLCCFMCVVCVAIFLHMFIQECFVLHIQSQHRVILYYCYIFKWHCFVHVCLCVCASKMFESYASVNRIAWPYSQPWSTLAVVRPVLLTGFVTVSLVSVWLSLQLTHVILALSHLWIVTHGCSITLFHHDLPTTYHQVSYLGIIYIYVIVMSTYSIHICHGICSSFQYVPPMVQWAESCPRMDYWCNSGQKLAVCHCAWWLSSALNAFW